MHIGANVATQILQDFGFTKDTTDTYLFQVLVVALPATFISFPLSQPKAIASLRYPSLIGICGIFVTFAIVIIQTPFFISQGSLHNIVWGKLNFRVFQCCGITYFAYMCQMSFSAIYSELFNPTRERINKVRLYTLNF
jgi:hypothetical protein